VIAEHRSGVPGDLIILQIPVFFSVLFFFAKGAILDSNSEMRGGKCDPPYLFIKVFQNLRNSSKSINKHVYAKKIVEINNIFFKKSEGQLLDSAIFS